jgi:hypothetical protein
VIQNFKFYGEPNSIGAQEKVIAVVILDVGLAVVVAGGSVGEAIGLVEVGVLVSPQ